MTAKEYFEERYPATLDHFSKIEQDIIIDMAECYAEFKLNEPAEKVFKPSMNAVKVSAVISERFGISLKPLIHRRYLDAETIKFEMQDLDGVTYFFEGLVMEFLSSETTMEIKDHTFKIW